MAKKLEKVCNRCEESKDVEEFSPDPKGQLGRRANCRECQRVRDAELRLARKSGVPAPKPVKVEPIVKPEIKPAPKPVVKKKSDTPYLPDQNEIQTRAETRAIRMLIQRHQDEYDKLVTKEIRTIQNGSAYLTMREASKRKAG